MFLEDKKCTVNLSGIVIPGSAKESDISASTIAKKSSINKTLLDNQNSGCKITW